MKTLFPCPQASAYFCLPDSTSTKGGTKAWLVLIVLLLPLLVRTAPAYAQAPPVTVSPTSLAFPNQFVGNMSASKTVTVTNTQSVPVQISSIAVSGGNAPGDYVLGIMCKLKSPLPAGQSCSINVRFGPTAMGSRTATLTLTENASPSVQAIPLSGVGMAPLTVTPASLAFGSQTVGVASAPKAVTVQNAQKVALTISSSAIGGGTGPGDYTQAGNCPMSPSTLGPGLSCSIIVTFTPSAVGSRTSTLQMSGTASNSPQVIALGGTGVAASSPVTVSATNLNFGNVAVGVNSAVQTVTLNNTQAVPLTISGIAISGGISPGDFVQSGSCPLSPATLGAGLSCSINVSFQPSALGPRTATLTVTDSASNSPQSVSLTGAGLVPVMVSPASLTFASLAVGTTSAAQTVSLTNQLATALSLSAVVPSGDFAVASSTCGSSVGAGATCSIGVTFTPMATGTRSGMLTINDSAYGSPRQAALSGTGSPAGQTWGKIQHVVIIFQENRTPDNLFQDPVLIANGADIASSGLNSKGQVIPLTPIDLGSNGSTPQLYDLNHGHPSFVLMYDGGKMDGADKIPVTCNSAVPCPPPYAQFRYVLPSDVGPYFQLAEKYTFGDRMFQTNQGPSFPAHQFIISGTSAPTATSNGFVMGNVSGGTLTSTDGCTAPANNFVQVIDPVGNLTPVYPCFEHPTLTDLLEAAGISWRYYTPSAGGLWTGPNAIEHLCGPNAPPPYATACTGPEWTGHVAVGHPTVLTDIANGQLPGVSWVIPNGAASDHASMTDGSGPSWVSSIVNSIGASQYWSNTIIIITWDDWGGWYDHVTPPVINDGVSWGSDYLYGFRVPLIVVSPYAKRGYISHVTHDFGSILHMVEQVFDLPSLGYADARADDLSDCFDFSQTVAPYQKTAAPLSVQHFLNDRTPPTDPDDD